MRVQIWSYNYAPEPQGIAPLSAMLAEGLKDRGHDVTVVSGHPHYPEPVWGMRARPYRERRNGVPVLRLPLWAGRESSFARIRQDLSFTLAQTLVAPILPPADVVIAVTPSFPALAPAMAFARARRIPWVMWLQDIATDGAVTTGQLDEDSTVLKAARAFERMSYGSAERVVVISEAFRDNLRRKGVPNEKIVRIFNPTSRVAADANDIAALGQRSPQILAMGNIGHSQGLDKIVDAFQESDALAGLDAKLVIAGSGVAASEVRAHVATDRIEMPGVLYGAELEPVLRATSLGLVSQRADIAEFNLPSKLMNYMSYGIPVLASVRLGSETANIVEQSGAGWVTDAADPRAFAAKAADVLSAREQLVAAGASGFSFARQQFDPGAVAEHFEAVLSDAVARHAHRQP